MAHRSYQTNLMLENLFYVIPGQVPVFGGLLESLKSPRVPVVAADCGTRLGMQVGKRVLGAVRSDPDSPGPMLDYVFHLDGSPVTVASMEAVSGRTVPIRHPAYCGHFGRNKGVCAVCALAGVRLTRQPLENAATSVVHPWTRSNVDLAGEVRTLRQWLLQQGGVTLYMARGGMSPYLPPSEYALLNRLADTYSGGLLGLQAMEGVPLPAKYLLLKDSVSDDMRGKVEDWVLHAKGVPEEYSDFLPRVPDNLEAALLGLILYGMFGDRALNSPPETFPAPPTLVFGE
jgi:hypothetical protein